VSDETDYSSKPQKVKTQKQPRHPQKIDESFKPIYEQASLPFNLGMMKYDKLTNILKNFNEYPEKYRPLIWRFLLELPLNKSNFESYLKNGIHPSLLNLDQKFPLKSAHKFNKLIRIMSALAHWCPVFGDIDYLPKIVYPFIRFIPNDDLVLFETVMSFFVQHC